MKQRTSNPPFLNGVPEMLILQLIASEPMYGYQLVQAIRTATHEGLTFGEGCIYPILHRLESKKLLAASKEEVSGRVRVVYHVTRKGKARLAEAVDHWERVVTAVNHALHGGERGRAALA